MDPDDIFNVFYFSPEVRAGCSMLYLLRINKLFETVKGSLKGK